MTHEHDLWQPPSDAAEMPLSELPRLRQVAARMRPPAAAEAAVVARLRHSVAERPRPTRTARKRSLTLAAVLLGSVPGLVAAHPDTRHWARQLAGDVFAALPWRHDTSSHGSVRSDVGSDAARKPAVVVYSEQAELPAASQEQAVPQLQPVEAQGATDLAPASALTLNGRPELPSASSPPRASAVTSNRGASLPAAQPHDPSLMQERQLLERAQRHLVQGDAAAALALTDEHARRFPQGILTPERLALRERALARTKGIGQGDFGALPK